MKIRWLLGLLLAGFVWAWVSRPIQADRLFETLIFAHRGWLMWAILSQVLYFGLYRATWSIRKTLIPGKSGRQWSRRTQGITKEAAPKPGQLLS